MHLPKLAVLDACPVRARSQMTLFRAVYAAPASLATLSRVVQGLPRLRSLIWRPSADLLGHAPPPVSGGTILHILPCD